MIASTTGRELIAKVTKNGSTETLNVWTLVGRPAVKCLDSAFYMQAKGDVDLKFPDQASLQNSQIPVYEVWGVPGRYEIQFLSASAVFRGPRDEKPEQEIASMRDFIERAKADNQSLLGIGNGVG